MPKLSRLMKQQNYYIERLGRRQIERVQKQDMVLKQQQERLIVEAMHNVKREAQGWFSRYATQEGIDPATAKMVAATADIKYLSERAKEYVANRHDKDFAFSMDANAEMRLYNLSMKVSRAEIALRSMDLVLMELADNLIDMTGHHIMDMTEADLYRQAMVLGETALTPTQIASVADVLTREPVYDKTFMETHWLNTEKAMHILERGFIKSLLQGKNPRTWSKALEKTLDPLTQSIKSKAAQIAITETAARQELLAHAMAEAAGFTHYMIISEQDALVCEVCMAIDGTIVPNRDMHMGLNAPPFHPFCRCRTEPYMLARHDIDDDLWALEEHVKRLRAMDNLEAMQKEHYRYRPLDWHEEIGHEYSDDMIKYIGKFLRATGRIGG